MAAILKHWREAATLIIVTARQRGSNVKPNFVNSSASAGVSKGVNFEVLLLKRSSKSKFMPNHYVFPGGVATDVDFSADWISVFDLLGEKNRQNLFDFAQRGGKGAPMFSRKRENTFSHIPSEIAFRICAIRETFEESGVLIAYNVRQQENSFKPKLWDGPSWASYCNDQSVIDEWRKKVDKDAGEFLRMCQELQMVPDVWSLYEWSNWLTPLRSTRRFDTSFFICCIQGQPHVSEDAGETVHAQWGAPCDILDGCFEGSVSFAPPQLYETLRLVQFDTVTDLMQFSWQRSQHRVDRWLPVRVDFADSSLFVLPGDSLYPDKVDPEDDSQKFSHDATLKDLALSFPNLHRFETNAGDNPKKSPQGHYHCNIQLPAGHISPLSSEKLINSIKSKF